jgi:3-hydroxybutyryl-CoA dehydrogenase
MEVNGYKKYPVLITGKGKLVYSIAVCLLQAGHPVTLFSNNKNNAIENINLHFTDLSELSSEVLKRGELEITNVLDSKLNYKLTIAISNEDLLEKKTIISQLEERLPLDSIIAINTESIPLNALQNGSNNPERVIGVNWVEPAHTTYFLELITNSNTHKILADYLFHLAKVYWNKDPYVICSDLSIRARMFVAMVREAFYLVENGYASIEDIDKACRNDAGYYLPFAGNFRYMDLMGTNAYGMVMQDLNSELSKECNIPEFFKDIITQGGLGMENNKGFYKYDKGDVEKWNKVFRKFSYQIQSIINKYPFNYKDKNLGLKNQIKSETYE